MPEEYGVRFRFVVFTGARIRDPNEPDNHMFIGTVLRVEESIKVSLNNLLVVMDRP